MAKNDIKGISIEIGGNTTPLTKALEKVDKQIKNTETDLKTVQRLLKLDPKNTEVLALKQKLLSDEIDTTKKKLEALKKGKEEADKKMKDGTEESRKAFLHIQEEILNTEKKLKSLEESASKFTQTGEKLQGVGNKMTEVGQKGMVLSGAITALGAGVAATAENTREYREDMSRLEAAFVAAGKSTESARSAYEDFYVILGESDRSVEAVNHLAKLCNSEKELADWSTICAGVSATFGDSLPIEGLTEAANETAKVGKVTGPLADALNWAGVSEDAFNESLEKCNSEQERSKLITDTLTGLYQNAAEQFKTMNADVIANREATQKWNDEIAELGAMVEPILTSIKEKVAELLSWFNQLNDGQKKILATVLAITAAGPPLLMLIGNTITSVGTISKALGKLDIESIKSCASVKSLFGLISAHPIGALVTALTAATIGLAAYAWANDETAKKIKVLTDESKQLTQATDDLISTTKQTEQSLSAQKDEVDSLIDRLYTLEEQDNKTTSAKNEMHSIINQLNSLIPVLNLSLDDETGRLNIQRSVVQGLADDYINLAYAKAYSQKLENAVSKKIDLEANNRELSEQRSEVVNQMGEHQNKVYVGRGALGPTASEMNKLSKIDRAYKNNSESIEKLDTEIADLSAKMAEYASKTTSKVDKGIKSVGGTAAKTAKSASSATKKAVDKAKEAFDEELKTLKEDLSYGMISEKEYYKKLEEIRDYYLKKGSSDWWTYTKEIMKYERDKADEIKKTMSNVSDSILSTTENYVNQRKQLLEPYEKALKTGSLYDTTVLIDGENKIEMNSLADFTDETNKIIEFEKRLEKTSSRLKDFFGDDEDGLNELIDTFRASPYGEGGKLMDLIGSANDEELKEYVEGFQEYNKTAKSSAESAYSKELTELSDNFKNDINKILSDIPEDFKEIGKASAEYFEKGFEEQMQSVLASIKKVLTIDFGGLAQNYPGAVTNSNINNSKTNNFNVNVTGTGQQDMSTLGQRIYDAIWLGGEL